MQACGLKCTKLLIILLPASINILLSILQKKVSQLGDADHLEEAPNQYNYWTSKCVFISFSLAHTQARMCSSVFLNLPRPLKPKYFFHVVLSWCIWKHAGVRLPQQYFFFTSLCSFCKSTNMETNYDIHVPDSLLLFQNLLFALLLVKYCSSNWCWFFDREAFDVI